MGCFFSMEARETEVNMAPREKRDVAEDWSESALEGYKSRDPSRSNNNNNTTKAGEKEAAEGEDDKEEKKAKEEKDGKDGKESKESKEGKEGKDGKDKDGKESKDGKDKECKDGKDAKDKKAKKKKRFTRSASSRVLPGTPIKLLLLGNPQTGKSTFLKQIHFNFLQGFGEKERVEVMRIMAHNLVLGYRDIMDYLDDKDEKLPKTVSDAVAYWKKIDLKDVSRVTHEMVAPARALWTEPAVQNVWNQRETINTFLIFNLEYIMENIERFAEPNAVATNEDILRSRQRTMASSKLEFNYEHSKFEVYDIGGQKTSRRQWAQMVENPTAIAYFAALSDYDVPVFDGSKMKLQDSLDIFEEITRYPEFANAIFVLMLNKYDVFAEKLKTRPLKQIYAEWEGEEDPKSASKSIAQMFCDKMPPEKQKNFDYHVICALETEQVKKVIVSIKEILTEEILTEAGVIAV